MVYQQKEIRKITICYLCGQDLGEDKNREHVIAQQYYPKSIRKTHNLDNLLILPAHKECNTSYKDDEDYFAQSFAPVVSSASYSGKALWDDVASRYIKKPRQRILGAQILKEFDRTPGGIALPPGKIVKTFDDERIGSIIWKITRGLFFYETRRFLPENKLEGIEVFFEEPPPEFGKIFRGIKPRGQYPDVVDYKYVESTEKNPHLWAWAMLFWDTIISMTFFHDPECSCDDCTRLVV